MKKLIIIATIACASFAFAAEPAHANGPMPRGPRGASVPGIEQQIAHMVMNPKFAEEVGLSNEQRVKVAELTKVNRDQMSGLRKKMGEARNRQAELLKAEKIDEAAVMKSIDEWFDVQKEQAKAQMKCTIAIKGILTPEQVAKATEVLKARRERGQAQRKMHQSSPVVEKKATPAKPAEPKAK